MLYEDITTGALLYGYLVDIENFDEEAMQQLNQDINTIAGITCFVPGDTVNLDFEDIYLTHIIVGIPLLMVESWEPPSPFDLKRIELGKAALGKALPALQKLGETHQCLAQALEETPAIHLSSCGPLSYTALVYGELHPSEERDLAQYQFHSQQNMDQEWHEQGVDGLMVGMADYSDITTVVLGPTHQEQWLERVALKANPQLFMTVRYD